MWILWLILGAFIGLCLGLFLGLWICTHDNMPDPPDPGLGYGNS